MRHVCSAVTAGLLTGGLAALAPAIAHAQVAIPRELHVESLMILPVVPPRLSEAPAQIVLGPPPTPAPRPTPAPAPVSEDRPVATTGTVEVVDVADASSPLPLAVAIGLLSLVGGFMFSAVRRRLGGRG